jgi:hypothetical protein
MKHTWFKGLKLFAAVSLVFLVQWFSLGISKAQSNISGDITGTVTDPSGAAVSNAQITVTSESNGQIKTTVTNGTGDFRVPLLSPGAYKISVTATGFQAATLNATVSAGTITPVNVMLSVGQGVTTVQVTGTEIPVLHTDDAQVSTSFSLQQIQTLPNPGNDLTFVAQILRRTVFLLRPTRLP